MSENSYEYLKRRCEILEQKVRFFESNMAEVSFKCSVNHESVARSGADYINYQKSKVLDGLARTITDSKYVIHSDESTVLGREIKATVYIFTGYKG